MQQIASSSMRRIWFTCTISAFFFVAITLALLESVGLVSLPFGKNSNDFSSPFEFVLLSFFAMLTGTISLFSVLELFHQYRWGRPKLAVSQAVLGSYLQARLDWPRKPQVDVHWMVTVEQQRYEKNARGPGGRREGYSWIRRYHYTSDVEWEGDAGGERNETDAFSLPLPNDKEPTKDKVRWRIILEGLRPGLNAVHEFIVPISQVEAGESAINSEIIARALAKNSDTNGLIARLSDQNIELDQQPDELHVRWRLWGQKGRLLV